MRAYLSDRAKREREQDRVALETVRGWHTAPVACQMYDGAVGGMAVREAERILAETEPAFGNATTHISVTSLARVAGGGVLPFQTGNAQAFCGILGESLAAFVGEE